MIRVMRTESRCNEPQRLENEPQHLERASGARSLPDDASTAGRRPRSAASPGAVERREGFRGRYVESKASRPNRYIHPLSRAIPEERHGYATDT